jgi:serine/threonine-protein kinase HipA
MKHLNWKLAPAYDVCYAYNPNNIWVSQHSLSINGKHKNIFKDDLMNIVTVQTGTFAERGNDCVRNIKLGFVFEYNVNDVT